MKHRVWSAHGGFRRVGMGEGGHHGGSASARMALASSGAYTEWRGYGICFVIMLYDLV